MKAFILAAGLGTRLKPWTLEHPKALVPVGGVPMLERVLTSLEAQGFDDMVVNVHHFGEQIIEYIDCRKNNGRIEISDERESLLDTGGGILKASSLLFARNEEPFLVHNVDILSNADLIGLMKFHKESGNDVTLLTSGRESSRKLIFDRSGNLKGWHNLSTGEYKPQIYEVMKDDREAAFSGIYVMGKKAVENLRLFSVDTGKKSFPIMDFFLSNFDRIKIGEKYVRNLDLLDIGKPASKKQADMRF